MKIITLIMLVSISLHSQMSRLVPIITATQKGTKGSGSQYWTKTGAAGFDFGTASNFSVIIEFMTTSPATLQRLVSKKTNSSGGGDPGWMVELRSSKIQFNIGDNLATVGVVSNRTVIGAVKYQIVITAQRTGNGIIYINGALDKTGSISTVGNITNALAVGVAANSNGASAIIGMVGKVQVVRGKIFSATEVASLYNARRRDLPARYGNDTIVFNINWRLHGADRSAYQNNLTPVNSPSITLFKMN